jgi:hypothetical protein
MTKSVTIDNLSAEIVLAVQQYTEDVSEAIEAELGATSKAVLDDVKSNSPVDKGEYRKGWRIKREAFSSGKVHYIVYQKSKPQLAHLLEFGHAKASGGRVDAKPEGGHIRPAYERHVPAMHERIKRIIEGGGK